MSKKILLGLAAVVVVAGGVAALSAYEAHVINVTARIENALSVTPDEIMFGTVFPQEYLEEELDICLSNSFVAEDRADNVYYEIRQKPKPRDVEPDGIMLKPDYVSMYKIGSGGIFDGFLYPYTIDDEALRTDYCHNHSPSDPVKKDPLELGDPADPDNPYYINCFPVLCPWLSKEKAVNDKAFTTDKCVDTTWYDCGVPARHAMGAIAYGHLVKSVDDVCDLWVVDLDVPCFEGQCAQDWAYPGWELPGGLESEVFGCDLWIEVTDISENTAECGDDIDNDSDGLIDFDGNGDPNLKDPECINEFDNDESA